ncbi:MAG: AzlC family ABC transporter permease [Lachnospiraceae bacterium]|nr:AzlC family ABC transporter permease [Lachnospiraceae bacterium]
MMKLKKSFRYSMQRSIPIMVGYFPVGIAYGILMEKAGYNFIWSLFSSLFVYAGSLQMLMVTFLINNVPLFTVMITALLLNSRHLFYGISFIEKFENYNFWKYFLIYGLSDENYSLLCSYKENEEVVEKWVHIFSAGLIWFYWILFSALGGLIGKMITFDTTGIDFALTALFVVILIEQIKNSESKIPLITAMISSVLWIVIIGADNFLLPSLLTTVSVLIMWNGKKRIFDTKEGE